MVIASGAILLNVSAPMPQNYMIHTLVLFVVLVGAMIWFLVKQWG
jgi:hypothetical protein